MGKNMYNVLNLPTRTSALTNLYLINAMIFKPSVQRTDEKFEFSEVVSWSHVYRHASCYTALFVNCTDKRTGLRSTHSQGLKFDDITLQILYVL